MKKNKDFRAAVMYSTYFNPEGKETLQDVNNRYGQPFKMPTLYRHMLRHQASDIAVSEKIAEAKGIQTPNWQRRIPRKPTAEVEKAVVNTVKIVEGGGKPDFEKKLDAFIEAGNVVLGTGTMTISAANYLAAIKIKADIEMRTKDRKLEALKAMFSGAAPQEKNEND